jgi:hypothetical protein
LASLPATDAELLTLMHRFLATNGECIKMRRRLRPVFADFDPMSHAAIECLIEKSVVLPIAGEDAVLVEGQPEHTFADADFQPTSTFLTLLKAEVAQEMETLWDRSDPSNYPSLSEEWRYRINEAVAEASTLQAPVAVKRLQWRKVRRVACQVSNASLSLQRSRCLHLCHTVKKQ